MHETLNGKVRITLHRFFLFKNIKLIVIRFILIYLRSVVVQGTKCDCKIDWLWVQSPFEEIKYIFTFIFLFLRSGGAEFRHSTRNDSRTRRKVGNGVS